MFNCIFLKIIISSNTLFTANLSYYPVYTHAYKCIQLQICTLIRAFCRFSEYPEDQKKSSLRNRELASNFFKIQLSKSQTYMMCTWRGNTKNYMYVRECMLGSLFRKSR